MAKITWTMTVTITASMELLLHLNMVNTSPPRPPEEVTTNMAEKRAMAALRESMEGREATATPNINQLTNITRNQPSTGSRQKNTMQDMRGQSHMRGKTQLAKNISIHKHVITNVQYDTLRPLVKFSLTVLLDPLFSATIQKN